MGGALELDSRLTQARLKLDWDSELTNSVFEICWQLASKLLGIPIMIDVRSWGSHVCSRERAGGRRLILLVDKTLGGALHRPEAHSGRFARSTIKGETIHHRNF